MRLFLTLLLGLAPMVSIGAPPPPPVQGNPFSTNVQGNTITNRSPIYQTNAPIVVVPGSSGEDQNDFANLLVRGGKLSAERMWYSVIDYGADPTANEDSRNAFQAAINAAGPGGAVFVPEGDYKIVATLPIKGNIRMLYSNGARIWRSLPNDYVNPNTYGANDKYTTSGVLDRNGNSVNWDSSVGADNTDFAYYGTTPWNGKAAMFQDLGNTTNNTRIVGLTFNGGWGTVNPPGTVIPITGVKASINENVYYQTFANCAVTLLQDCRIENEPGTFYSHGFGNMTVRDCEFGEYGDHLFYCTSQGTIMFVNNKTIINRAQVSSEGNAAFVSQTYRDSIKLRNMTNSVLEGNTHIDANASRLSQWLTIESSSSIGGTDYTVPSQDITITGNNIRALVGILAQSFRTVGVADGTGLRTRMVNVNGGVWDTTGNAFQMVDFACDGFTVNGGSWNINRGKFAMVFGNQLYSNAISGLTFRNLQITSSNLTGSPIGLGGSIKDITLDNVDWTEAVVDHGFGVTLVSVFPDTSLEYNRRVSTLGTITIKDCDIRNAYALINDQGPSTWVALTTYNYSSTVMDDGTFIRNQRVFDAVDSQSYTNKATVMSATPPSSDAANWGVYQPTTTYAHLISNERFSDSSVTFALGASKLANTGIKRLNYNWVVNAPNNANYTTLAQPITYEFNPGDQDANSAVMSYTNVQRTLGVLDIKGWARINGTDVARAGVHNQTGSIRSDGQANTPGTYIVHELGARPDIVRPWENRGMTWQLESESIPGFGWRETYNGIISNTVTSITSPVFMQGIFGKMSGWQYVQTGQIRAWVNNGEFGSGTASAVPAAANGMRYVLDISPGATTNDLPFVSVLGNLNLANDDGVLNLPSTITAAGVTGAQTINKIAGRVNFAGGATSLVVTDARVTANSVILISKATNDGTARLGAAVADAGFFTIYMDVAPAGECAVNFLVIQ